MGKEDRTIEIILPFLFIFTTGAGFLERQNPMSDILLWKHSITFNLFPEYLIPLPVIKCKLLTRTDVTGYLHIFEIYFSVKKTFDTAFGKVNDVFGFRVVLNKNTLKST